jgi:hypothetical protein
MARPFAAFRLMAIGSVRQIYIEIMGNVSNNRYFEFVPMLPSNT